MLAGEVMLRGTTRMQSIFLWDEHPLPSVPAWRGSSSSSAPKQSRLWASPWFLSFSVDGIHLEAELVRGNPTLCSAANTSASLLPFTRKSSPPFLHKKMWVMLEKFGMRPSKRSDIRLSRALTSALKAPRWIMQQEEWQISKDYIFLVVLCFISL